ncbi:N-acyl-aromatic-L-amino acid amidohydrolase (carboxylate-forming) B-like [Brienomyrus brachyistius]|uniref:N-acyl-aromatic-L-amino acid amidohydrolase (carboxylate-forming) B-like n=1 Tax=Brienomyrus brachyistius TaxID=42636 RepID=UPI0020B40AA2|nr:N-acyl-aromatic-L-amino acid amidohydrolase (carboxylate-forming) B-like [Brienomyrus brachyistius]XP_048851628.1 N-acyl-aromatic-L-amino acid amidohydrolase (carboxylate-forming) B-like [Brienomyrus brachyistius]XP_048851629.1 N-acyl-aromatic-L-amino acid amidohydrolase (carboxylate-forming) B-like [Brienomyrus brachyistius]XP_048851630.1 N-acyl-aromatic-L-amino acid amidohydrolase (carboxylate-forming) B-like [Brienomyrus brachyistius]
MDTVRLPSVTRVAICGGTHGNELSGVYLVRELQKRERETQQEAEPVSVVTVLSNPRAVQQCRRYTEMDLNRCFTSAILSKQLEVGALYEMERAQELNKILGPRGSATAMDLVCDLHNTTANMGLCLIAYSDDNWISLHVLKYLQREIQSVPVRLVDLGMTRSEAYSLESLGKHGLSIEVGPQPHGVLRADIFSAMQDGVRSMLDWIRRFNSGTFFQGGEVDVYTMVRSVDYPRDPETGSITAIIHPQLQDRDFCVLRPGDPMFLSFTGETQLFEGEEPLYPIFVNECAYYEKGIALWLTRLRKVQIPPVQVQAD